MKWVHFIFSHSIFISLCAGALSYQTYILLHISANVHLCWLIFFATLGSYNFYWLISKFHFAQKLTKGPFLVRNISNLIMIIAASFGLIYFFKDLTLLTPYFAISVFLTLLYSMPLWPFPIFKFAQKMGFMKTLLLALSWTFVTVILPVKEAGFKINDAILLLFFARFLFMLILCLIFDSRDIKVDKIHSLRSLATDISNTTLRDLMTLIFCLYLLCGIQLRIGFDDEKQVIAFILTGVVSFIVYRMSLKPRGYFFYYFLVDGLMLFSAITSFVASI